MVYLEWLGRKSLYNNPDYKVLLKNDEGEIILYILVPSQVMIRASDHNFQPDIDDYETVKNGLDGVLACTTSFDKKLPIYDFHADTITDIRTLRYLYFLYVLIRKNSKLMYKNVFEVGF